LAWRADINPFWVGEAFGLKAEVLRTVRIKRVHCGSFLIAEIVLMTHGLVTGFSRLSNAVALVLKHVKSKGRISNFHIFILLS
jgi:hypothetical protein